MLFSTNNYLYLLNYHIFINQNPGRQNSMYLFKSISDLISKAMKVPMNLTILLIETKSVYRNLVIQTLGNLGFSGKCIPIKSYEESLLKINQLLKKGEKIDFIISEFSFPDGDGAKLIQKIRNNKKLQNIPILAISDKEDPQEIVRAFEAGIDNYLIRPIDDLALLEKIEYCWRKRKVPLSA